jgi:hypothetical protein
MIGSMANSLPRWRYIPPSLMGAVSGEKTGRTTLKEIYISPPSRDWYSRSTKEEVLRNVHPSVILYAYAQELSRSILRQTKDRGQRGSKLRRRTQWQLLNNRILPHQRGHGSDQSGVCFGVIQIGGSCNNAPPFDAVCLCTTTELLSCLSSVRSAGAMGQIQRRDTIDNQHQKPGAYHTTPPEVFVLVLAMLHTHHGLPAP